MKQVTCTNCGRQIPEDAAFCPGCKHPNETFVEQEKLLNKQDTKDVMPNDGLVWSLICAVFFFWPVGIAAAIYSSKVDHYWFAGNKSYAMELVRKSKKLRWISFGITMGVLLFVFILSAATDRFGH